MTLYYSEDGINTDVLPEIRKKFPRGEIGTNHLKIKRANTIDYKMLLKYFDCAITKTKDLYNAAITLPTDLEYYIPSWVVQGDVEIWVNPKPDLKDFNMKYEELFITEFHFYVDERKIHKIPETKEVSTEEALIEEFIEIRHALIQGNEEPIDVFRKIYTKNTLIEPKTRVAKYLDSILKQEK